MQCRNKNWMKHCVRSVHRNTAVHLHMCRVVQSSDKYTSKGQHWKQPVALNTVGTAGYGLCKCPSQNIEGIYKTKPCHLKIQKLLFLRMVSTKRVLNYTRACDACLIKNRTLSQGIHSPHVISNNFPAKQHITKGVHNVIKL